MVTEIELKYLVISENTQAKISQLLLEKNLANNCQQKQLSNCYFDTPQLDFRAHDMGLRVRGSDGVMEQTIKTSGVVIGGLHQRPEYNVDIDSKFPTLSLFPTEIWQASQKVEELQQNLVSLFSTDFLRTLWLVSMPCGAKVEIAFDQGDISSDGRSEIICEMELELVTGDKQALFTLAKELFSVLLVRPSSESKAARGYRLRANKNKNYNVPVCEFLLVDSQLSNTPLSNTDSSFSQSSPFQPIGELSLADSFASGINECLTNLHDHIEHYLLAPSLLQLEKITETLALMRHGFWLYKAHLTSESTVIRNELSHFIQLLSWVDNAVNLQELTNKTGNYRKKLEFSEQLIAQLKIEQRRFPNVEHVTELLHSERFNQLALALLTTVITPQAVMESTTLTLNNFSQEALSASMKDILSIMPASPSLNSEQYLSQAKLLNRSLLTGSWLGALYDSETRTEYRTPWLDMQQGISELQTLWLIQQQLQKLDQQPQKLVQWQSSKVEGLLSALDSSRQMALSVTPYWQ
jgi:triphosphatase